MICRDTTCRTTDVNTRVSTNKGNFFKRGTVTFPKSPLSKNKVGIRDHYRKTRGSFVGVSWSPAERLRKVKCPSVRVT